MKIHLSKAFLETLKPTKARQYFQDDKEKGLYVSCTSKGTISFFIRKSIEGRQVRVLIGNYPDVSIVQARRKAQELKGVVASGKNPITETTRKKTDNQTFEELFEMYMERYSKKHKKSWRYDEREVKKFLSDWFKRRISTITKTEIQLRHEKIYDKNGLYQANRILERIRAMYNKAIEWGWDGSNPTLGIKKYKEKSRDRFVQPKEMPYLMYSINIEENETAKDFFWILLLTGMRKTNTLMMRWDEITWERNEWRIPDSKNGEPLRIALAERAIAILKERKLKSKSEWVFPQQDDLSKHYTDPKRAWKRTLSRATVLLWEDEPVIGNWIKELSLNSRFISFENFIKEIKQNAKKQNIQLPLDLLDIRMHDIRRTFGSYQALSGASLQVIGKSLGHKSQQSTQVYARLNLDPVRSSIEKAVDVMFSFERKQ